MEPLPILGIKETCLYPCDLDRSRSFYEGKLGLSCFSFVTESHAFFRAGRSVLLCFLPESSKNKTTLPRHFASGEQHFAFEVRRDVYNEWRERIVKAGIAIEHDEVWNGGFHSFYFRDPDMNCVEVIESGMWEYKSETK